MSTEICQLGKCKAEASHYLIYADNRIHSRWCAEDYRTVGRTKENDSIIGCTLAEYAALIGSKPANRPSTTVRKEQPHARAAQVDRGGAAPREGRQPERADTGRYDSADPSNDRHLTPIAQPELPAVQAFPRDLDSRELAPLNWGAAGSARFTAEQEAILRQSVNPDLVEIRYDGAVYMPGAWYRKILNDCFGPGGWYLALEGQPQQQDGWYYLPAVLVAEGRPVARTVGEYRPNQRENKPGQGTIWESCCTDAISKCCKTLGVAEELWFPTFTRAWQRDHAVQVGSGNGQRGTWKRREDTTDYDAIKPGYSHGSEYARNTEDTDQQAAHLASIGNELQDTAWGESR
jgi:hypothetical protein